MVAASRLGSVLIRSADGRWKAIHGPLQESLLCVLPVNLPDAELLAVTELGNVLRKPPGRNELLPVDIGKVPHGALLRIAGNPTAGWYLMHQRATEVSVLHSPVLERGSWTTVARLSVAPTFWTIPRFWTFAQPNGFGYATSEGRIHVLDYATGTWTETRPPQPGPMGNFEVGQGGKMGYLGSGAAWSGKAYLSSDGGRTWTFIPTPFTTLSVPRALGDGRILMASGVWDGSHWKVSGDGGKNWQEWGRHEQHRVFMSLKDGTVLGLDRGQFGLFFIQSSTDGGKTWSTEYSNFDRSAYKPK